MNNLLLKEYCIHPVLNYATVIQKKKTKNSDRYRGQMKNL